MQVHRFKCFGEQPGDGNPALVIEGDLSPSEARLAFARERNITCVWIDPPDETGVVASVDYFSPSTSPCVLRLNVKLAPTSGT